MGGDGGPLYCHLTGGRGELRITTVTFSIDGFLAEVATPRLNLKTHQLPSV